MAAGTESKKEKVVTPERDLHQVAATLAAALIAKAAKGDEKQGAELQNAAKKYRQMVRVLSRGHGADEDAED